MPEFYSKLIRISQTDEAISQALDLSVATIERVRQRFVETNLETALSRQAQQQRKPRRLDGEQEVHLVAITCGEAPEGLARWRLRLLAQRMVELEYVESVSHETIRQTLKKTTSSWNRRDLRTLGRQSCRLAG